MMPKQKITSQILFFSLILLACFSSSCSKVDNAAESAADGSTVLEFIASNVSEIENGGSSPEDTVPTAPPEFDLEGAAHTRARTSKTIKSGGNSSSMQRSGSTDTIHYSKELVEDDFDVRLSFTENRGAVQKMQKINNKSNDPNRVNGTKVAAAMPTGNRYRVLIYDANDNYVGTIDASSGTAFTPGFPVFQNTNYKWYAYSFNSTAQMPDLTNTANPTITTTAGTTALLYDAGTLRTVAGSNKINITFEHKLASVALVLDARGMFSTINSITASNSTAANLRTGTLNLRTGNYASTTANGSSTTLSNWTNLSTATGDSVKVAYFYTSGTQAIQNFGVNLTNFVVNLDDGTTRTFTGRTYTFSEAFTPQLGSRYTARITLIESPVTVANIRWGRENLYYRASDGGYRFRNKSSNIYNTTSNVAASGEYFNFGAITNANNAATAVRDVCRRVFPVGTWRLPTNDEFIALAAVTTTTGTPRRVFGQSADSRYAGWTYGNTSEYGTNWVTYLALGRRDQNANTITGFSITSNASGYFWSSSFTQGSTTARYMRVDINGTSANSFTGSAVTANLQETMTFGMNIRCVRI